MIYAYDEKYLDDAMRCLGEAIDYATNSCHIEMDKFMELFIGTGISKDFEIGTPKYVTGISGIELCMDVITKSKIIIDFPVITIDFEYSPEYWCGWILAYYQWKTNLSFKEIHKYITMKEIEKLYTTLHESSEDKFVDVLNNILKRKKSITNLQYQRKISGYSQKELAEKTGISLRTLQQYEIKSKDINKAATITLLALSRQLGCRIEDLLEYNNNETK